MVFLLVSFVLAGAGSVELRLGQPVRGELKEGESHSFSFSLEQGQLAHVRVMQDGVDIIVILYKPDGQKLQEVDSPNGTEGIEPLTVVAPAGGIYRLELKAAFVQGASGRYEALLKAVLLPEEAKHRVSGSDPKKLAAMYSGYQLASGREVYIGYLDELGRGMLCFMDTATRAVGRLMPCGPDTYYTTPSLGAEFEREDEVVFRRNEAGELTGVTWREKGGAVLDGKRIETHVIEEVSFTNGPVTLKGFLALPSVPGPHPVLVHAHGSQGAPRHLGPYLPLYLRHGVGVLSFDKRGAGESTGDWKTASFDELVADLIAGIGFLKTKSGVDASRIGVTGYSQGGWIAAMTAAKCPDVHFVMVQSGSGVPVYENVVREVEGMLRRSDLPEADVQEGRRWARLLGRLASDGVDPRAITAACQELKQRPWWPAMFPVVLPPDHFWLGWYKLNGHYSSVPYLRQVRCPVLWCLGDHDFNVPTAESQVALSAALTEAGNPDFTVRMFANANHGLMECKTGLPGEAEGLNRMTPGYLRAVGEWLDSRVSGRTARPEAGHERRIDEGDSRKSR